MLSLLFLGTGTSSGVPQIGCNCPVCTSADPRDKRMRSGAVVSDGESSIIVDTPPEFRLECVKNNVCKADAFLITHAHMDHIAGFDDVRRFNTLNGGEALHCYAAPETIDAMHGIFPYITDKKNDQGLYRPQIVFERVEAPFKIGEIEVSPVPVVHGPRTNGWLFKKGKSSIAYIPDCREIPPSSLAMLQNTGILVIDCLRKDRPHPTHMILPDSLQAVRLTHAKQAYFTHICHSVSHAELERLLPPNVHAAYDSLAIEDQGT